MNNILAKYPKTFLNLKHFPQQSHVVEKDQTVVAAVDLNDAAEARRTFGHLLTGRHLLFRETAAVRNVLLAFRAADTGGGQPVDDTFTSVAFGNNLALGFSGRAGLGELFRLRKNLLHLGNLLRLLRLGSDFATIFRLRGGFVLLFVKKRERELLLGRGLFGCPCLRLRFLGFSKGHCED